MTTNNVVSDQHSAVIQNQTTGQIDFLRFNGSSLQASVLRDYGIGGWNVVANGDFGGPAGTADGFPDLVVQSQATGQLDFLWLNASANLIGSALGPVVARVVGVRRLLWARWCSNRTGRQYDRVAARERAARLPRLQRPRRVNR